MVKTHTKKMEAREGRLSTLPRKARYAKSAEIKKQEGRVLDSNEKRALKMKGSYGSIVRAWEILRASADTVDEKLEAMKSQAKLHGAAASEIALAKEDFETATGRRTSAVDKVLTLLKGKFEEFARTPTGSRVVQSCIKFGTNGQREQILTMMSSKFSEFCTDGFAHFAVEALVRHTTKGDFKSMMGLILNAMSTLATHKCGLRVVNALYNHKLCSATEKHLLVLGIFKDNVAVMKGWKGYPILEDIIEQEVTHRRRLVTALFEITDKLVSQKEAMDFPFVQRLLCVLFTRGGHEQIEELAASLKDHLVVMAQSRDGARLASLVFGVLPPKSRKVVLQTVAQNFTELVGGKFSPPFLARCFDLTYDAQMLHKYLVGPLVKDIGPASGSPYGCRVLLHLLTPDADRKARVMLPDYADHNLYSRTNQHWNLHTWYDSSMKEETVQICDKNAEISHHPALREIAKAFCDVVCAVKGLEENRTLKGFVARIASEMYHLHETEPAYRAALALTDAQVERLETLRSNKDRKEEDAEENAPATEKVAAKSSAATSKPAGDATPATADRQAGRKTARAEAAGSPQAKVATPATAATKVHRGEASRSASAVLDMDDEDAPVETSARAPPKDAAPTPARRSTPSGATPVAAPKAQSPAARATPSRDAAAAGPTPVKSALKSTVKSTPSAAATATTPTARKSVKILNEL